MPNPPTVPTNEELRNRIRELYLHKILYDDDVLTNFVREVRDRTWEASLTHTQPWRTTLMGDTELDALLSRVLEDKADPTRKNRNVVAYDYWRMFEDLAICYMEEFAIANQLYVELCAALEGKPAEGVK